MTPLDNEIEFLDKLYETLKTKSDTNSRFLNNAKNLLAGDDISKKAVIISLIKHDLEESELYSNLTKTKSISADNIDDIITELDSCSRPRGYLTYSSDPCHSTSHRC